MKGRSSYLHQEAQGPACLLFQNSEFHTSYKESRVLRKEGGKCPPVSLIGLTELAEAIEGNFYNKNPSEPTQVAAGLSKHTWFSSPLFPSVLCWVADALLMVQCLMTSSF